MVSLVFLVENIAFALYAFIVVGFLWWGYNWRRAYMDFRETYFELERSLARYRIYNALTAMILLIEVALVVHAIQTVVAPTIREQEEALGNLVVAPVDLPFTTPTPFARGDAAIDDSAVRARIDATDPALAIQITPTLTPTPVGTIIPNPPAIVGCDTNNAMLQIPANGMVVFQPIQVVGIADIPNFTFYRFELRGQSTFGEFATLAEYTQPVTELSTLGQFVPSFYEPGEYQFRLNVFDINGEVKATCMVNILISEPIPTPTPLPSQ